MQPYVCSNYFQKLKMTKTNIESEYIGADSELSTEILDFLAIKPETKARHKDYVSVRNDMELDEYELAMIG